MQLSKNTTAKKLRSGKKSRNASCHQDSSEIGKKGPVAHPDHGAEIVRLNRIKGQVNGVERMILDQRYCPEILIQVRAVGAALKSLESAILEKHLKSCVKSAFVSKNRKSMDAKVDELMKLFMRSE